MDKFQDRIWKKYGWLEEWVMSDVTAPNKMDVAFGKATYLQMQTRDWRMSSHVPTLKISLTPAAWKDDKSRVTPLPYEALTWPFYCDLGGTHCVHCLSYIQKPLYKGKRAVHRWNAANRGIKDGRPWRKTDLLNIAYWNGTVSCLTIIIYISISF